MHDTYLTLVEASKLLPNRPHGTCIWRWCTKGVRGVKLQSWRFGRHIVTTAEALEQFGRAVAAASAADRTSRPQINVVNTARTDPARARAIEAAKERLQAAGL